MRARWRAALILAAFGAGTGCVATPTDVSLSGQIKADAGHRHLEVDTWDGGARIDHQRLDVPHAVEEAHYGVGFVETSPLPVGWRPAHAPDGGLLASAVDCASPLAIAGLRPYDLLLELNGAPASDLTSVVRTLATAPRVVLRVRHATGVEERLEAEAVDHVESTAGLDLPLVGIRWSHLGVAVEVAPVLWFNSSVRYSGSRPFVISTTSERDSYASYFGWGALLDLFLYRSWTDLRTGEVTRTFRLFWAFELGDDPWEKEKFEVGGIPDPWEDD